MTTPGLPPMGNLMQIAMPVQDIERAVAFYRDTLGVPFLFQAGNLAFFNLDGVRLMIEVPEDAAFAKHASVLYFRVPSVEEAHAALLAKGVNFEAGPHIVHRDERMELWMAFFHDGEGNMHALAAEKPLLS